VKIALTLAMEGASFTGTAVQVGQVTLHGRLRELLAGMHGGERCLTRSSGRLDAGVSAQALVLHCILPRDWDPRDLGRSLNAQLRGAAVIWRVAVVDDAWDALTEASRKTYRYTLHECPSGPLSGQRVWQQRQLQHPERLVQCARAIVGRHDLSAFAALRGNDSDGSNPIRSYTHADWRAAPIPGGTAWTFRVSGEGFLYKQVRGLVGAQVAVAHGLHSVADFQAAVGGGRAHPKIGQVAPAEGLSLEAVRYEREPAWQSLD
jgi:tRNA pseudouridine38-40 synthase